MEEKIYHVELTGITYLLMHQDDVLAADEIEAARSALKQKKGAFKAGDDRYPTDTWKSYLYHNGEQVVLPVENLSTCLREAGARITQSGKRTFKSASQVAISFPVPYFSVLADGRPLSMKAINAIGGEFSDQFQAAAKLGLRIHVKRATIGSSKHVRCRPCIERWSAGGLIHVRPDIISFAVLQDLWSIAGDVIGIGDWRPSSRSPGRYGRFTAVVKEAA